MRRCVRVDTSIHPSNRGKEMAWFCKSKLFIREIMNVPLDLRISSGFRNLLFRPNFIFKKRVKLIEDLRVNFIFVLKIMSRDIFDFVRFSTLYWIEKFLILISRYSIHFVFEHLINPVKFEEPEVLSFFSFVVFLWVCVYHNYLQLSRMSQIRNLLNR